VSPDDEYSDDQYSTVIDQALDDAVRATLVVPHASLEGAAELRRVATRLGGAYGPVAVRTSPKRWPRTWPNYSAPSQRPISATHSRCSTSGPTTCRIRPQVTRRSRIDPDRPLRQQNAGVARLRAHREHVASVLRDHDAWRTSARRTQMPPLFFTMPSSVDGGAQPPPARWVSYSSTSSKV
jgi:hypothetical protein